MIWSSKIAGKPPKLAAILDLPPLTLVTD